MKTEAEWLRSMPLLEILAQAKDPWSIWLEAVRLEAYQAGESAMRERAALAVSQESSLEGPAIIRALRLSTAVPR